MKKILLIFSLALVFGLVSWGAYASYTPEKTKNIGEKCSCGCGQANCTCGGSGSCAKKACDGSQACTCGQEACQAKQGKACGCASK